MNKHNKNTYFNHQLNITKNNIESNENDYISDKIMWKNVKNITDINKQTPPRVLSDGGKVITSLKQIYNIANRYYICKIQNIINNFQINNRINLIQILSHLIKRNSNEIKLKYETLEQITKII